MQTLRARPLLQSLTRANVGRNATSNLRSYQLHHLPLRGSSQALARSTRMDGARAKALTTAEINQPRQSLFSLVQRISRQQQRPRFSGRGFHYTPQSYWQLNKGTIVIGGTIGICCAVFAGNWWAKSRMDNLHDPSANVFIRENTVCSLENVRAGRWWVMVTSAFQHNDFIHLGFNMITLWSFGPLVVSAFGVPAFLAIYASSQTVCTAAFLGWQVRKEEVERWSVGRRWGDNGRQQQKWLGWLYPKTDVDPGTRYFGSVGASGALSGLIAAWACFAPRSRVAILFVPMLAYKEMVAFVAGSLICMEGGYFPWIAHEAHLGGTVGGILSYYALVRPWIRRIR